MDEWLETILLFLSFVFLHFLSSPADASAFCVKIFYARYATLFPFSVTFIARHFLVIPFFYSLFFFCTQFPFLFRCSVSFVSDFHPHCVTFRHVFRFSTFSSHHFFSFRSHIKNITRKTKLNLRLELPSDVSCSSSIGCDNDRGKRKEKQTEKKLFHSSNDSNETEKWRKIQQHEEHKGKVSSKVFDVPKTCC